MDFYGRKEELSEIKRSLSQPGYRGIMVYGRRHVGKSRLIAESVKEFPGLVIYAQCVKGDNKDNIASIYHAYKESSGDDLTLDFPTLDSLLGYILSKIETPLTIVLDEYPYWREYSESGKEGLDSLLQKAIDRILSPKGVKLIISGSYLSVMDEIRGESNPLGGRFKTQVYLQPMDYYEAAYFYPNYSPRDKIVAYSVFGGLPYILQSIDPSRTVLENIESLYFSSSGELRKLLPLLVEEEIGKSEALLRMFLFLANTLKRPTLRDIHAEFQSRYTDEWVRKNMAKLESMKVVKKVAPIGSSASDRNAYYQVCDNAFLFYYRFVYPYESAILLGAGSSLLKKNKERINTEFASMVFETASKEFLIRMNKKGLIDPPIVDLGTYFYNVGGNKNGQFDLVSKDERGYVFYECKYRELKKEDISEEKKQVESMPSFALHPYKLGFIAENKGKAEIENDIDVYTLDDFFLSSLG